MAIAIIMPKAGMAMEEGTIIRWLVEEGGQVKQGEPLLEILTDKVNMEVEAQTSGILLKILKQEGEVVPVTQVIGYIGQEGESIQGIKEVPKVATEPRQAGLKLPEEENNYDVVVVGGGPAGYVAAIKASMLGGKVALIEKDVLGGTCLNRGCIPTKAYLKNAEILENIRQAAQRGIHLASPEYTVDMEQVVKVKDDAVRVLTSGVAGLLMSHGVKVYKGAGKLTKDRKVSIDGREEIQGKKIILASGSKPSRLAIPGIESKLVLTSDEILDLTEIPNHLIIIGGGVIGLEMASVFRAYGSQVTIVEMEERLVPFLDQDISEEMARLANEKDITVLINTKLQKIEEIKGQLIVHTDKGELKADKALLSIGRVADLDALGEMEFDMERGKVKVNERMETSQEGIYAAGDINGKWMLAHAAFKMGEVAAMNALGGKETVDLRYIPSCIYTTPEVGSVGLTEEVAKEKNEVSVGRFVFGDNGRALASGEPRGFVKVVADKRYGQILGVHIVGPAAAEIINEAATLMSMEITVHELSEAIHAHPTFSEALMEAAADSLKKSIHKAKVTK